MNININFGNPTGMYNSNMSSMGANSMAQMLTTVMQIMMSLVSSQTGHNPGQALPFGNPGFGQAGSFPQMGSFSGASPTSGFLGNGTSSPALGSPHNVMGSGLPSSRGGQGAVDIARRFLGQRSRDIKGKRPHFQAAGGLTNNCADFVSSALRGAGMLGGHEINCRRLESRLQREGWKRIPASQAGPGDVAFNQSRGHLSLIHI